MEQSHYEMAPKFPFEKTLNPSDIRMNSKLKLRKDNVSALQSKRRFENFKSFQITNSSLYEINIDTIIQYVDPNLVKAYNTSTNPLEIIFSILENTTLDFNSNDINNIKYCSHQLKNILSSIKTNNSDNQYFINSNFPAQRVSHIVTLIYSNFNDLSLMNELSWSLILLTNFSKKISNDISQSENISRLFYCLTNIENFTICNNLIIIIANCLIDADNFSDVIKYTSIANFLFVIIEKCDSNVPIEYLANIVWALSTILNSKTYYPIEKDITAILPKIVDFMSSDINYSLFYESLSFFSKLLGILENLKSEKSYDNVFILKKILDLKVDEKLCNFISIQSPSEQIIKIIDSMTAMSYLSNNFCVSIGNNQTLINNISALLYNLSSKEEIRKEESDIIINVSNLLNNLCSVYKINNLIVRRTNIVEDFIRLLYSGKINMEAESCIIDFFDKILRDSDECICLKLLCIDFPSKVIVKELSNNKNSVSRLLTSLKMVENFLTFGESILTNGNLFKIDFVQNGISSYLEKIASKNFEIISDKADKLLNQYFKITNLN